MKTYLFFFCLLFSFSVNAQIKPCRQQILLKDNWKFAFGSSVDAVKDFNYGINPVFYKASSSRNTAVDAAFNDSSWRTVSVPHDWVVELPFAKSDNYEIAQHGFKPVGTLYPNTSIGWYRKHFNISSKDSGMRFQIQFDGVFRDANFWINGFYIGNNKSGYLGVTYDITDFINFDKDNVITVRADATQFEGWFYEGAGIYRKVWLIKDQNIRLANDGLFLYSTVTNNKAVITADMEIENFDSISTSVTVQSMLLDRQGKKISNSPSECIKLQNHPSNFLRQKIKIKNPRLWSLEDPYLYRILVLIKHNNIVVDSLMTRFGIRSVQIKPNGVFLNGKYVKIKGTNNHQDHAGIGTAMPDYLQYYRLKLLQDMGCNSIRTSHNSPTPELLDACDSLGILVLCETRILNSGKEYASQFERLLKKYRSRTCIYLWSIGNEEGDIQTKSNGKRIALSMIALQKAMDPTRTCTYASDLGNVYHGINEVIPVRGFNYRESFVEDYHKEHPLQPIIGTEMGSTVTTRGEYRLDTIKCYLPDKDITAPWWASTAEKWWKLASDKNYWLGGYIWTGFDYRGEPTPFGYPNINSHFGVFDICGFPKNLFWYYQSWWTEKDVIHLLPHWNWKGKEGDTINVWCYSNAQKVSLFLNGDALGTKTMQKNGHLEWNVAYKPGKLEAVGYKNDKVFKTFIETTDEPFKIQLTPTKYELTANGEDICIVNVCVVDKNGRIVPNANNLIHFQSNNIADMIGVGNGDPSSHEADKCDTNNWKRSLFNGYCQIIMKASEKTGTLKLMATSEGLQSDVVEIKCHVN